MKSTDDLLYAGFSRAVISPPGKVSLAGYFAPRFNRGILDDLWVKACLFRQGETIGGLVQLDLLEAPLWLCGAIRAELTEQGTPFADNLAVVSYL